LDREAEEYRNVQVTFIQGRKAVLTIFEDDKEKEKIILSDYKTKDDMHKLFVDKGFERKTEEEIRKLKEAKPAEESQPVGKNLRKPFKRVEEKLRKSLIEGKDFKVVNGRAILTSENRDAKPAIDENYAPDIFGTKIASSAPNSFLISFVSIGLFLAWYFVIKKKCCLKKGRSI